ncbi:MAG: class I tRNA ligase family protein, partial [Wolbachia pipientis]|nr:class I tRNA ligase family protein [Wolbachia pipientis]
YFAAFCSEDKSINENACNHFMPVDYYIGGIEHATLHLLYSRFFCRALTKCGYFNIKEPFSTLIIQGMVCHTTYKNENGKWLFPEEAKKLKALGYKIQVGKIEKMSKSKKNIIDPNFIIEKYGADTARLFVLSDTPPEKDIKWSEEGIKGCSHYINKLWCMIMQFKPIVITNQPSTIQVINIKNQKEDILSYNETTPGKNATNKLLKHRKKMHKLLYELTDDLKNYRLNCAIAKFREMTNLITKIDVKDGKSLIDEGICILIRVIEPFIPHLAESLWQEIGGKGMLYLQPWPEAAKSLLIDEMVTIAVQINGKLSATIEVAIDLPEKELKKVAISSVSNKIDQNKIQAIYTVPNKVVNIVV